MRLFQSLSIRLKIVAILLLTLSVSLGSYLWVGTRLVIEDKVSYIYDFNLAHVRAVSESVESQILNVLNTARIMGATFRSKSPPGLLEDPFARYLRPLGPKALLVLRNTDEQHFKADFKLGDKAQNLEQALSELGWTPQMFKARDVMVGVSSDGELPIGGLFVDGDQKPAAFVTTFKLNPTSLDGADKSFEFYLLDSLGKTLLMKSADLDPAENLDKQELERSLLTGPFNSGVRDWRSKSGKQYIVAYRKVKFGQLMVASFIDKKLAFLAAKRLAQRSLALGISILLLALGLTIVFAKTLTFRLRQVWYATKKVSEGDFGVRVQIDGKSGDEVGSLATSFNSMAEKIGELMAETAHKARMEKELETAQALQRKFFPPKPFEHPNLALAGSYLPASECAGDWWNYARIGPYLVIVVGDVTGHGVSSALVTAAAHGAFALLVKQLTSVLEKMKGGTDSVKPPIATLLSSLNTAIRSAAVDGSTMTLFAGFIHLETGMLTYSSASHVPAFLMRKKSGEMGGNEIKHFEPLSVPSIPALGRESEEFKVVSASVQLAPGDRIFLYTDGLFESPASKRTSQRAVFKILSSSAKADPRPTQICEMAMSLVADVITDQKAAGLPDDITLVVAAVPESASFGNSSDPKTVDAA